MPAGVLSARNVRSSDGVNPSPDEEDVDLTLVDLAFRWADLFERVVIEFAS